MSLPANFNEHLAQAKSVVRPNLVKQRMQSGQIAHSLGLRIVLSTEIALLAERAGYHAVLMNLEHSATGLETMSAVSTACMNVGITPMVVVPTNSPEWISRSLDSGAQAVIVPHVSTLEAALVCVKAAKYRPIGERSMTMLTPLTQYSTGIHFKAVSEVSNDAILIMPMIETRQGVENVEEIAAVKGIDVLLIGCGDLCVDLDIPGEYDNPTFHSAVAKVCAAASKNGIFVGFGGLETRADLMEKFTSEHSCARYLMSGRDIVHLFNGMKAQCKQFEEMNAKLQAKGSS
ncbi:Phosphoenolpyruvate/pyruvate domain-containing protein [Stereum hirsutum FP-91666 SS1]|uniref:Phosphoenolpyruvate/pyruvate domain-containing protein n=1 Tax=Stereum hirsutum (strain FP-91666) TaxID=721885 RepID=UPI000440A85E|nr:Phosphoenolpyruvate/pyruvate domain-containing protein [Stereum hirsutum FP-91666 SS1]EIM89146.1 Phosphoenolpyruvate/pyruvate domain-containing protein [Stereum hirsutum FP-91666 SS1]